jgi:Raf kinase inhibitor-like YbhB/YbcL family protein
VESGIPGLPGSFTGLRTQRFGEPLCQIFEGGNMKANISRSIVAICIFVLLPIAWAQDQQAIKPGGGSGHKLRITSTTFSDRGTIPQSMVFNPCSFYPGGGNQSPQLSWTGAPNRTRSFIVVAYDVTASFTHWGMYNIAPSTTSLPENAGIAGSSFGTQVSNDFGILSYDGPCPPPSFSPVSHQYVFTVYALDVTLPTLPTYGDFPPGAEQLYHALIAAGRNGDILGSASISGFFP